MNNESSMCEQVKVKWEREAALKYYEIHVIHREQLFNWILVFFGAASVAYSRLLVNYQVLAGALAIVAAAAAFMFFLIGEVTLKKIRNSKVAIVGKNPELEKVFGYKSKVLRIFTDPILKRGFYLLLIVVFGLMAWYAMSRPPSVPV